MRVTIEIIKNTSYKTYFQFTLIEMQYINTFQVWSINIVLCNVLFRVLHVKSRK